jgi:hypothetical protein
VTLVIMQVGCLPRLKLMMIAIKKIVWMMVAIKDIVEMAVIMEIFVCRMGVVVDIVAILRIVFLEILLLVSWSYAVLMSRMMDKQGVHFHGSMSISQQHPLPIAQAY